MRSRRKVQRNVMEGNLILSVDGRTAGRPLPASYVMRYTNFEICGDTS